MFSRGEKKPHPAEVFCCQGRSGKNQENSFFMFFMMFTLLRRAKRGMRKAAARWRAAKAVCV